VRELSFEQAYQLLADCVLALHLGLVAFIVGGLALIVVGNLRSWSWVNRFGFRIAHLGAITIVAAEAWIGLTCPLTGLEMWLRAKANATTYSGGFVEHWLQWLLYYDAPPWVFALGYTLFALATVAAWWTFPPNRTRRGRETQS
jgi:hypothetical protein